MSESESQDTPGIMGSLPSTRPGTRSPRRDRDVPQARPKRAAAAADPGPTPTHQVASTPGSDELEALAKAGISVAAGAASLGLKLAGRAAGALRNAAPDSPDRDA